VAGGTQKTSSLTEKFSSNTNTKNKSTRAGNNRNSSIGRNWSRSVGILFRQKQYCVTLPIKL